MYPAVAPQGSSASAAAASTAAASNIPAPPAPAKGIGKVQSFLPLSIAVAFQTAVWPLVQAACLGRHSCTSRGHLRCLCAFSTLHALALCRAPRCSRPHRRRPASCQRPLFPWLPLEPSRQTSLVPMVALPRSQPQDDLVKPQSRMCSIGALASVSAKVLLALWDSIR